MRKGLILLRRAGHIASMITLIVLTCALSSASQRPEQAKAPDNYQANGDGHSTPPAGAIQPPTSQPHPDNPHDKPKGQWEAWKDTFSQAFAPEYWSQWFLFVAGAVGIAIAICTLRALDRQVTANDVAAKAAKKSADAARASADAIKLTERAQIGVPHDSWTADLRFGDDPRYNLEVTYCVRNAGQTLGYFKMTVFHIWKPSGPDDQPTPMESFQDDAALEPWAVILPGESIPRRDHPFFLLSQDEIDKLANGKLVWWTMGRVSYRDLFGNVHYTNFTSRLYLPSKSFSFPVEKGYADGN